jgi:DNA-binding PadR family transcriptional regulator
MTKGTVTAYTIMQTINDAFQLQLSPGTIYNTLNTLERKGYINRKLESPEITITAQGKALVLKALRESETMTRKIHDFLQRS